MDRQSSLWTIIDVVRAYPRQESESASIQLVQAMLPCPYLSVVEMVARSPGITLVALSRDHWHLRDWEL